MRSAWSAKVPTEFPGIDQPLFDALRYAHIVFRERVALIPQKDKPTEEEQERERQEGIIKKLRRELNNLKCGLAAAALANQHYILRMMREHPETVPEWLGRVERALRQSVEDLEVLGCHE